MANHPEAMAELRARLAAREPLYAVADYTIETATLSVSQAVDAIARLVSANFQDLK